MQTTRPTAPAHHDDMIRTNMPLVGYAVSSMAARIPRHVPREDLMSAGMLGLTQAAQAYDPSTGVPFDRFARLRIKGALLDELRSRDWASRSVRRNARRMQAARDTFVSREGRTASLDETAAEMGVEVDEARHMVDDVHRGTVLNYQALTEDGVDDMLPAPDATPEANILDRERRAILLDAIAVLPERQQAVINAYFFEERPMADIADEMGVTESRISQIRAEAFEMIRAAMEATLEDTPAPVEQRPNGHAARRRASYYAAVATASTVAQRLDRVPAMAA
ncbi:RNA polymerase sigma factor for flagellar operon [Euzebya pacifica]|uniref:RNA polymerase sigma factor for flagellar operon n=1 Tax=Euzebya pacifica TaxID=1608957 RepID=A0A346XS71_9ACTN|nr:sigma-70 family RNA polymerase sigma factor [Euzebya pacifica]AXV05068.1 RNA polymerase sigma factor for flagellar operon [Euzebya pacifica]